MTTKEKVLVVIPARAGSKRIPNKNIRKFLGRPLIVHTIKQALSLDFVDRVVVDTDFPKIAKIAKKYGAEVPFLRPARLAKDNSLMADSIFYLLKRLRREENYVPDYVMLLQITSPLREKKDIIKCWKMIHETDATTVLTVCPTHPRLYHLNKNNNIILANKEKTKSTNTQDWPQGYILNGCFVYLMKIIPFLKEGTFITKNTKAVVCPKWRSIDLDVPEDWVLAETIYRDREAIKRRIKQIRS
ncbi:MAG: hypothetical protein CMI54_03670 [Parcubacteria group bacterium]|nr:hypothetical protein [Parcubacteria group bacterium]|tara:strand:- start:19194 stop:19925 length:732 start_codon:yes stop_codon:yes gene_type:complete